MNKIIFLVILIFLSTSHAYINNNINSSSLSSLNGQTGSTQVFGNDTNVTITSSNNTHQLGWTSTLAFSRGGTGASLTGAAGGVPYYVSTSALGTVSAGTSGQVLTSGGSGTPTWSNVSSMAITSLNSQTGSTQVFANDTNFAVSSSNNTHTLTWLSTLSVSRGGTGASLSPALGNIVYTDASKFSLLAAGTSGQYLISGGAASPSWGLAVDATKLPLAGGTMSGAINMGGFKINNMSDPASGSDAATKSYVDNLVNGLTWKVAVAEATTAALPTNVYNNGSSGVGATLTGVSVGALSIDGVTPSVGDRVLVKNEVAGANNGIYTVTAVGSGIAVYVMTRSTDFDQSTDISQGDTVFVDNGTVNSTTSWSLSTSGTITVGTTALVFAQVSGPGSLISGTGISISGMTISLITPVTISSGGTNNSSLGPILGGVIYSDASKLNTLAAGTSGQILKSNGAAAPSWTNGSAVAVTSLTGDVTGTGPGATATTIATGAVTDTKASLATKPASTVVATSNQTLSGTPTIDGQATAAGSIILLTAQTSGSENGPWVAAAGAWSRPTWYPSGGTTQSFQFITTLIRLGTTYQGSIWRMTTAGAITIDTTATSWAVTPHALNTNTVTGTLPIANGGTNGTDAAVLGGVVYTDASSYKVLAAGTSGQFLKSAGASLPTWSSALTSLNSQTSTTQVFANDTNITITSSNNTHTLGWASTLSVARGGTGAASYTAGSIPYSNGSILTQDNADLFWDGTNHRLGITTTTPAVALDLGTGTINGNGAGLSSVSRMLNYQSPLAPVTGTSGDATIFTYTLPGNTMGAGKCIRVSLIFRHTTGSTNTTYKFFFGSSSASVASTSTTLATNMFLVCNNNSVTNAQTYSNLGAGTGILLSLANTAAEDTTANVIVKATFNVANTDAVTPDNWLVELVQ